MSAAEKQDLLLGIDLGTSRSAVTSSRGCRETFDSAIGYPRDLIGVRLLGGTHVVGAAALGKNYLDVKRPLENGLLAETADGECDAARKLLQHAVALAAPKENERVCAIIGVPANASNVNKLMVLKLASEVVDMAMVMSEPFLVAYGMEQLVNALVIDIGAGTTDLCALKGRVPTPDDQFSLTKAGDSIDDLLMSGIGNRYPNVQITKNIVKHLKEQYAFVGESKDKVMVTLRESGKPVQVDITREIQHACESIVPDIVEHTAKLIATFDPADQASAVANIILAGGGSLIKGLDQMIADSLSEYGEVQVSCVGEVVFAGCDGALKLAAELPPQYWDQVGTIRS